MAQKRMFDKKVVESDKFLDLPNSSKALYFMAGMEADDKGFFQPRKLQRMCGFSDDDYKILIAKGFFIAFESGVMVVTDWNKNNWLDSRRITETEYVDELKLLKIVNEKYELDNCCLASAKPMLRENRIEENRIEENNNIELTKTKNKFSPPTLEEIEKYIEQKKLNVIAKDFYNYFSEGKWADSKGNKVKNWKQKLLTWNKFSTPSKNITQKFQDNSGQYENLEKYVR